MSECLSQMDDFSSSSSSPTITEEKITTNDTPVTPGDTLIKSREEKATLDNNKKNYTLINDKNLTKVEVNKAGYMLVDGKKIRSALAGSKRRNERRVSFPDDDKELVTGYLEPANPWLHADDVSRDILISSYVESCERHKTEPLKKVLEQLEVLEINNDRCEELCLHNECLEKHCEPLEEILKRVQFKKIDLESAGLNDESAEALFDMVEYYESAKYINISRNGNIGTRGWQACSQMIKKTQCLEQLDAKSIVLTQQHMNILKRPLQLVSHLQVLKVENCRLAGAALVILVAALKPNTGLKELYLADNGLEPQDAIQLGALMRVNHCLQFLDISNNNIRDDGVHNILDGMKSQSNGYGLKILILWNNHLTKNSAGYFADTIANSNTLETLNIGQNALGDDFLHICKDALERNITLLQLGVQATGLMKNGVMALAEVVGKNSTLQRIDLRDNHIQLMGLTCLCMAMKNNCNITQIDLDDNSPSKAPSVVEQYMETVTELRSYCRRNDEEITIDSSTEESGSPEHRSRLSSVNSRKISLTCQTLPRSPNTPTPNDANVRNTTMLEPKRTSGGRLRSPAPSPIPSPVASPIPSPSRSRFVVSRVSEASLSSTNSSTSSSPVTPPPLASSPSCFFPNASGGSSRFRVTIVESNVTPPTVPAKNVIITPENTNVTVGFNYRVDVPERIDSDDSDSVFRSEGEDDSRPGSESTDGSLDERIITPDSGTVFDVDTTSTTSTRLKHTTTISQPNEEQLESPKEQQFDKPEETHDLVPENIQSRLSISKEYSVILETAEKSDVNSTPEVTRQRENTPPKTMDVPKQSSLEKLLGLFQHPGNLFTSSINDRSEAPMRNPLQGSVSSMIALGDRFQQYLRDTTRHAPLQRSVSDAPKPTGTTKSDPVKSLSIDYISTLEATTTGTLTHQDLLDEVQEPLRRLSEVREDDNELDNLRIENRKSTEPQNDTAASVAAQNEIDVENNPKIDKSVVTNNDNSSEATATTRVPVLTFKSEYSITIGVYNENNRDGVIDNENTRDNIKCDNNGTKDSINNRNLDNSSAVFPIVDDKSCVSDSKANNADDVHNSFINNYVLVFDQCKLLHSDDCSGSGNDNCCRQIHSPVDSVNNNNGSNNNSSNNNQGNETENEALTLEEDVKEVLVSILNVIPEVLEEEAEVIHDNLNDFHNSEIKENISNASHNYEEKIECHMSPVVLEKLMERDLGHNSDFSVNPIAVDDGNEIVMSRDEIKVEKLIDLDSEIEFSGNPSESARLTVADNNPHVIDCRSTSEALKDLLDYKNKSSESDSIEQTASSKIDKKINFNEDPNESENLIDFDNPIKFASSHINLAKSPEIVKDLSESEKMTEIFQELAIIEEDKIILKVSETETETSTIITDDLLVTNFPNLTSTLSSTMDEFENPQTSRSPTNLFIERSRNIHRNSQDSGIEETTASISDDNLEISPQPRGSFQESLDSGIDSECSSVSNKVDNVQSSKDANNGDKYYNIPVIDAHESQSNNGKPLRIKTSVFVVNDEESRMSDDAVKQSESKRIDNADVTIIGTAKLSQDVDIVSTSTSLK